MQYNKYPFYDESNLSYPSCVLISNLSFQRIKWFIKKACTSKSENWVNC